MSKGSADENDDEDDDKDESEGKDATDQAMDIKRMRLCLWRMRPRSCLQLSEHAPPVCREGG